MILPLGVAALACGVTARVPIAESPATACGLLYQKSNLEPWIAPLTGATEAEEEAANQHNAGIDLSMISLAAERACVEDGHYPASLSELHRRGAGVKGIQACVLRVHVRHDPWVRPYRYVMREGVPFISSAGRDGRAGTADDISLAPPARDLVPINAREDCVVRYRKPPEA